jgi:hypothetical protein
MDDAKMPLPSLRGALIAFAVIGCSLSSLGASTAHADYYWHHRHWHHRHYYYDRHHHHGYYRYY